MQPRSLIVGAPPAPSYGKQREQYMLRYPPEFRGDGRVQMQPSSDVRLPGMVPTPLSRSQCRAAIDRFEQRGESHHSALGSTVWVIVHYLHWKGEGYSIKYTKEGAWAVFRLEA